MDFSYKVISAAFQESAQDDPDVGQSDDSQIGGERLPWRPYYRGNNNSNSWMVQSQWLIIVVSKW